LNNLPSLDKQVLPTEQPTLITPGNQMPQNQIQIPGQNNSLSPNVGALPPLSSQVAVDNATTQVKIKKKIVRKDPLLEKMNR